jgi:WD40 repeat protein/tetratricopeptide (TPR) repeat protein/predicted Ser/Thr protein kinase
MNNCPARDQLALLLAERLGGPEAERVEAHVQGCARCQEALGALCGGGLTDPGTPAAAPEPRSEFLRRLREACPDAGDHSARAGVRAPTLPPPGGTATGAAAEGWPAVPGYEVLGELGRGGMGVVYKARQLRPARVVALKVLLAGAHAGEQDLARFRAEAEAVARLQHPNVVQVYEVGEEKGCPYLALEYVEGGSLADKLKGTPLSAQEAARLAEALARAVHAAHEKGVVHRDLKPANVLLTADGTPKVTDFGLAKRLDGATLHTQTGAVLGTPDYMAPEQAEGKTAGPPADIHALGALLYQMLTGRPPFLAENALDTLLRVRLEEPVSPSVLRPKLPRDLGTVCLKCLQKDPARRYASALAVADDLHRFLGGEPVQARPVGRAERLWRWCRRNPAVATLAAIVAALLAGVALSATGLAVYLGQVAQRERAAKDNERDAKVAAQQAQQEATSQAHDADQARQRAEASDRQSRQRLVQLMTAEGMRLVDDGDLFGALPWLAEALRLDAGNPEREDIHRRRLAAVLRQCPRLEQVFFQNSEVFDAAFSPDGRRMITASGNSTSQVWDLSTGRPVTPPLQHTGWVKTAVFSRDGRRVVTAAGKEARVWDAAMGKPITEPLSHDNYILGAALSPDGRRVASWGDDQTARVWDAATGRPVSALKHARTVVSGAFSPDGRRFLTGSHDGTARVWDVATGKSVQGPLKHGGAVNWVAFSPDGTRIVTASFDGTARVWDAATGQPVTPPLRHTNMVVCAAFSPDGGRVVTASFDRTARVWDAATGVPVTPPLAHRAVVVRASFSPDGRLVATAGGDGTARIWDAATGDPAAPPLPHGSAGVDVGVFSPDGRRLVTGGSELNGMAKVWNLAPRPWPQPPGGPRPPGLWLQKLLEMAGLQPPDPGSAPVHLAFSPDGRQVISAAGRSAWLWEVATGRTSVPSLPHGGAILSAAFSTDGRRLVTTSQDGTARVWDASTGRPVTPPLEHGVPVVNAAFSPDGENLITAGADETARVWDVARGQPRTPPLKGGAKGWPPVFSPDGRRFLMACAGDKRPFLETATGRPLSPAIEGWVRAFSPDGHLLLRSDNFRALLLDASTGREVAPPLAHSFWLGQCAFSPDGRWVATSSADKTARVWEVASGSPVTPPLEHALWVLTIVFSPDGRQVATASCDNTARVWDAATGRPLTPPMQHQDWVLTVAFSRDGRRVFTACRDQTARVWDAATGLPVTPTLRQLGPFWSALFVFPAEFVLVPKVGPEVWDPPPDDRPVPDLVLASQVLAAHEVDPTGGYVPLKTAQMQELWADAKALDGTPTDRDGWHNRGRAHAHLGHFDLALLDYDHALKLAPEDAAVWLDRSFAQARLGQLDRASDAYLQAVRYAGVIRLRPETMWGRRARDAGADARPVWEAIVADGTKALDADAGCWWLWRARGLAFAALGRWDRAAADFGKAAELKPDDVEAWRGLGRAHAELGAWQKAEDAWTKALALQADDWSVWYLRGYAREQARQFEKAIGDYSQAAAVGVETPVLFFRRGSAYAELGRWRPAADDLTKAVGGGTAIPEVWHAQALAQLATDRREAYRRISADLLERFDQTRDANVANDVVWTCVVGPAAGVDHGRCVHMMETADAGQMPITHLKTLGAALYRAGRFEEAVRRLDEAIARGKGGTAWDWLFLAMSYHRLGRADEARQAPERAARWVAQAEDGKLPDGSTPRPLPWTARLELRLLRREAEELLGDGKPSGERPEALIDLGRQGQRLPAGPSLAGHTDLVTCVAYRPDGRLLASGSYDRTVRLWDLPARKVVRTLEGHTQVVWGLAFSPDGTRLASSSGNHSQRGTPAEIKLWDLDTGRELRTLPSPGGGVYGLAWSPDGKRLASAGFDKAVRLWDPDNGKEVRAFRGHANELWAVAFSPDGRRLASAGFDRVAKVWDVAAGKEVFTATGHAGEVWSVSWSPDGKLLATASDDWTVRLWDASTGQERRTLRGHTISPYSVCFGPDSRRLLSASGHRWQPGHPGEVFAWDAATGKELARLGADSCGFFAAAFAPDGRHFACAAMDKTVKLCDLEKAGPLPDTPGKEAR